MSISLHLEGHLFKKWPYWKRTFGFLISLMSSFPLQLEVQP